MNELNKLYKAMLLSWGALVKDDSRIVFTVSGSNAEIDIRIDDQDMYLPTSEVLEGPCVGKVFFHPACENITSKETEVFKIIRKMTGMKILDVFRKYPIVLIGVAAGPEKKAWKQETLDLLEPLKKIKRSVRDELSELFKQMKVEIEDNGLDNRFIHFKVTKGGGRSARTGEKVYYKTRPTFPFYDEIVKRLVRSEGQSDNQLVEINGFSVSRAALKVAAHLFQSIIPAVQSPNDYEFESIHPVAARLVSYLGCYTDIAEQLNRVQNIFRADFDKAGVYPIDVDWAEHMEELPDIYRQVPVLDYNSHNTQDEITNTSGGQSDMSGFMSVSSNNQQQQLPQNVTILQQPNQQQQQQLIPVQQSNMGFDTTPPVMEMGDRYVRSEIDMAGNRVIHHAVTMHGAPVIYLCTRQGNKLQRTEIQGMQQQQQMVPGMMMPGMMQPGMMGMMPGMMGGMMPNMMGMQPNMMGMYQMSQPVTSGGGQPMQYGGSDANAATF